MTQHDYAARFQNLLAELFMLEQADLDFGIYRVMNTRRKEIESFLEGDLLPQIHEELQRNQSGDRVAIERELQTAQEQLRELGVPEDSSEKVRALRVKLDNAMDVPRAERDVFNHLYNFFSRYYQGGDFLSLRRYKRDVYALPYEGEEVKLHWANADQYYIKTGEYFRDYTFTLGDGRRVHFKLAAADTEQNNNKANNERERRFTLASESDFLRVEDGELIINFAYQPDAGKRRQADINSETAGRIFAALGAVARATPAKAAKKGRGKKKSEPAADDAAAQPDATQGDEATGDTTALLAWAKALTQAMGTNGNPERTVLEKHLNDYTARNTFDYFIHKDLNGFLRREMDFYIKNEVMLLDDIERESAPRVENYLAIIRAIRRVGLKIIEFLAQLEDFQKSLWLKKKFVVETHWCVTLDRVPPEFYAEIAANERQRAEWVRLFAIDEINGDLHDAGYSEPLTVGFLEAQPHLVLDTSCFDRDFTERLLATDAFQDLDEQTDGVLIESENFQALNLLQARYREQIKCIYIDPPYNTGGEGFIYKDGYQHSSWISMITDRLRLARSICTRGGVVFVSIDDNEYSNLLKVGEVVFGETKYQATIVWQKKDTPANDATGLSGTHDFILVLPVDDDFQRGLIPRTKEQTALYKNQDNDPRGTWTRTSLIVKNFVKSNTYALTNPAGQKTTPPAGTGWSMSYERMLELIEDNRIWWGKDGGGLPFRKKFLSEVGDGVVPVTWWDYKFASSNRNARAELRELFQGEPPFETPKPTLLIKRILQIAQPPLILDFFAGSGTTAHAVINLNREDDGARKFILVEMGEYFHTVTLPRVLKVIYSKDWRDGKPVSRQGSSCLVKILRLESYEDTLNNLRVHRTAQQQDLLAAHDSFREDYTLRYLFGRETAGSPSLLNLDLFENPFDYRLDIGERGSSAARVSTPVDLIETFNYLLGLRVTRRRTLEGFRIVEGATLDGTRTLIIWRNSREQDNDALNRFFLAEDFGARGFQVIYANGDHTLGMTRRETEMWQPLMIEADFKRLMFEGQG